MSFRKASAIAFAERGPESLDNRAITYFTAWAERHQRSQDTPRQEAEALLRVQHTLPMPGARERS